MDLHFSFSRRLFLRLFDYVRTSPLIVKIHQGLISIVILLQALHLVSRSSTHPSQVSSDFGIFCSNKRRNVSIPICARRGVTSVNHTILIIFRIRLQHFHTFKQHFRVSYHVVSYTRNLCTNCRRCAVGFFPRPCIVMRG